MLITIEGIDGTGKSSAAKFLAEELGFKPISTPSNDYAPIRSAATSNKYSAYYYYLSSCYYVSEMARHEDIVCDRYIHSTIAYNWPFPCEIPENVFGYYEGLRKPEISFLLCASDGVRRERMNDRKRKGGIISELDSDFRGQEHAQTVYMKYHELLRIQTDGMTLRELVNAMKCRLSNYNCIEASEREREI